MFARSNITKEIALRCSHVRHEIIVTTPTHKVCAEALDAMPTFAIIRHRREAMSLWLMSRPREAERNLSSSGMSSCSHH